MNSMSETKFRSYMQSLTQERPLELQQITQNPSPPPHLSSIGSTSAVPMWYPIDDITGDMPYRLHIPIGRVGNKTKEVAIGVAIPVEYVKVLVCEITDMACINYPLDHVTHEGIRELGEAVNQFILWNRREIILDGPTTPQNQLMSPLSQMTTPKDNEATLPTSSPPVLKFKEASLPSSPKEKETSTLPTSPVKVMPQQDLGHQEQDLPPSSPYNIIHQELDLYNPSTRSVPTNKFFEVMKKQKMSTLSTPAQHAKSFLTAAEIGSYEEDGEVYDREKLGFRPDDPVFMKHEVPKKFEFGKPFLTSVELFKRHFPVRRLHNWYMIASSLGVTTITFQILGNTFYSGARLGSIEWEDLWLMFHRRWLDMNILVVWCL
jgi:hypothetical protein